MSSNVEDRRGARGPRRGLKLGLGGTLIVVVLALITGRAELLGVLVGNGDRPPPGTPQTLSPAEELEASEFVAFVLDDAQEVFASKVDGYRDAKLVLFTDAVRSACGLSSAATGPFYCPGDEKAYIDLGFYAQLRDRFGAPGDFAQAYVIAHEIGHHVQNITGVFRKNRALEKRMSRAQRNASSVRQELQADCFAGVWAHSTRKRDLLEKGDIEEGLNAAAAIGDDRLQAQAGRRVSPESFTHGTSEQRVRWFRRGFETGDLAACDTTSAR